MRRTYRSKKDASGALDHRDVLLNMDEKSSAFDAFYIQNIKQTKRELSCIGASNHFGVASNKVRKKKYVKRIIKEVQPVSQKQSMSPSAFLTPDKSIRVNKVLDPFDMLLNSSPAYQDAPKMVKDDTFDHLLPKKESKTYTRKKLPRLKKFQYSSSDNYTDSDKENTSNQTATNYDVTDIRTHKLLVEREPSNSPKYFDESIDKIVNNISLLNNIKCKNSSGSFNTSYKLNRSRLTKHFNSPILQKSPLCSTPFKDKYRGVSIYKFSPISQKEQGSSPNCVTIAEEKDESNTSIILVGKTDVHKVSKEYHALPLTHLPNNSSNLIANEKDQSDNKHEDIAGIVKEHSDVEKNSDSITNVEYSSFQTTEAEPFFGFTKCDVAREMATNKICLLECIETDLAQGENNDLTEIDSKSNRDDSVSKNSSVDSNRCNTSRSSTGSRIYDKESMYDTCNSEQSSVENDHYNNRDPKVVIERLNDSVFIRYYAKMEIESQDEQLSEHTDNDDFKSFANDSNVEMLDSMNAESDFMDPKPNTIVITDSSTTEDIISSNDETESNEEEGCVNFVTTRRRNEITNDSMFVFDNSYGSSSTECEKTILSNIKVDLEKSDVNILLDGDTSDPKLDAIDSNDYETDELKLTDAPTDEIIIKRTTRKSTRMSRQSNILRPVDEHTKTGDSPVCKRLSRITTRKSSRLPRQSDATIPQLYASKNEITLVDTNEVINETVTENVSEINPNYLEKVEEKPSLIPRESFTSFRGSTIMSHPERPSYAGSEVKPNIVLQPGKKWERSLSIYRRMTMASDHFDQSILDDECLQRKGRKYRQSVISTMEMQEDLLHNDSINSRRSTFVSKPSRPTIRFVKDPNFSRVSLSTSSVFDELKGFLNEECDDTVIELSKLSIADSEHEVTILDNFHEAARVTTARDYVLRRCNQTEPIPFDECYPETVLKNCHKIGEGVYGEVFLWRGRDGRARVMKIVPIAGTVKVNGEDQKDFHEIISEIVIAMELSALRAPIADIERQLDEGNDIHALDLHAIENATDTFNEVHAVRCVYGSYPSRLLDLWELYDECKGSENDTPAALPVDQQFIVLELANAGQDLESFQFASAQQAHALFQQIAFGLAVAEEAFQFEHRDLHWGNVLIAPTEQKLATFVLRGRVYRVARCGVAATVIDYSLSRLALPLAADCAALYNDLAADDQLFDAVGDYQFQVYRLMRDKLGNDWKNFEPYTNILWLHYTVDKMITALRYKRTNTKIHKHYIAKLKGIKNRILEYGSTVQYVLTDIEI